MMGTAVREQNYAQRQLEDLNVKEITMNETEATKPSEQNNVLSIDSVRRGSAWQLWRSRLIIWSLYLFIYSQKMRHIDYKCFFFFFFFHNDCRM